MFFFFFKQKTAYEMRISDWSSDVCSSDLYQPQFALHEIGHDDQRAGFVGHRREVGRPGEAAGQLLQAVLLAPQAERAGIPVGDQQFARSEEHTSELQSLMRISYAVFCLKKKHYARHEHTRPRSTT